jgi:tellurite resistance protein
VQKDALELLVQAASMDGRYADEEKSYLHAVCEAAGLDASAADARVLSLIAG